MSQFHDLEMNLITGEKKAFRDFAGTRCLIVNVASKCGLTPQYEGLRELQEKHEGLTVLGFPCNQFGAQEPGTSEEIREFAQTKYGVNFPLFDKVEVNGPGTCALYQFLKAEKPGDIAWNFTKFLVDGEGRVVERFEPSVTPEEIAARL